MDMIQAMQAVEDTMTDIVASDVETLRDASRHILKAGGKRIRPRLAMLAYAATGGEDIAYAAPVAAAIELVHTASVVHDDINDHGSIRRGRPSVNAIWGRTFALLTGDFLFTKVYELMAPYKDLNVILADATIALVEGETLQAAAAKDGNLSREVYYQIIARKTAALFKAAGQLGAELTHSPREHIEALGRFGYNVGLAFQIIDDVLDLIADADQLGKSAGIDVAQGKGFGTAYMTKNGNSTVTNQVAVVEDPLTRIKQKILEGNAIEEAQQQATMLVDQAIRELDILPQSSDKDSLIELARLVVERDY
jgi:geranylgeranyl pyrophosphate synthase